MYNAPISQYFHHNCYQRKNAASSVRRLIKHNLRTLALSDASFSKLIQLLVAEGHSPNHAAFCVARYKKTPPYQLRYLEAQSLINIEDEVESSISAEQKVPFVTRVVIPSILRVIEAEEQVPDRYSMLIAALQAEYREVEGFLPKVISEYKVYDHAAVKEIVYRVYPALRLKLPLEVGIGDRIQAGLQDNGLMEYQVNAYFGIHCGSLRYLANSMRSPLRFNESGFATTLMSEGDRLWAARRYLKRLSKYKKSKCRDTKCSGGAEKSRCRKLATKMLREDSAVEI
ncbi:ProQ/FINO family protein [Vibrio breoganii]|uniref:ProQ/FINO family protein n=2 Tax=Vibrio TaxID=662 RepID=UPI000C81A964|nr:ProQ/FINO family protein [Vibrio breoganii]PML13829.1 hypothetical protein BCT84_12625 [Vibrio breoganii]